MNDDDLPPPQDVQQAVDALCAWLDANTWVDLNDDEAHVVDAIMHGARLLKWLPLELKLALVESWSLEADVAQSARVKRAMNGLEVR